MTTIDDAFATPVMLLRPSSFGRGAARPRAALVIRFPGNAQMREVILRGLLGRGWQLVAAPAGEFEPEDVPRAHVRLSADMDVEVEAGGETVFAGFIPLHPGPEGHFWPELARSVGEVLILLTVGPRPIMTVEQADEAARSGHLIGLAGTLFEEPAR